MNKRKKKTLEEILKHCEDRHNYPAVFRDDVGLDIRIPEKRMCAAKTWGEGKKRRATLKITSFRGISFEAIHFYGSMEVQGVEFLHEDDPERSSIIKDDNMPLANYIYRFRLQRVLTKKEIESDPERWEYYEEGFMTEGFDSENELIALAKDVFMLRFSGEWEFYVEYSNGEVCELKKDEQKDNND